MAWIIYNPDKTLKGLEARYRIKDNVLQIELEGANHKKDWYKSIFVKSIKRYGERYNRYYYYMAFRLYRHLRKYIDVNYDKRLDKIVTYGHSMGGSVGCIFSDLTSYISYRHSCNVAFGSPRSGSKKRLVILNYGELAHLWPFWYPRYIARYTDKKWQWFWKAHKYNWRFKE